MKFSEEVIKRLQTETPVHSDYIKMILAALTTDDLMKAIEADLELGVVKYWWRGGMEHAAKICDEVGKSPDVIRSVEFYATAEDCAEAIREEAKRFET